MKIIRDIWVCDDCLMVAVNGDYTGLDYHYGREEADRRMKEIDAGLDALPGLVCDDYDSSDPDSIQYECKDCGYIHTHDHFREIEIDYDGEVEKERQCPECDSIEVRLREDGRDEFSWHACDCCGSQLGGSRTRMAQLIHEDKGEAEPKALGQ